jgi:pimeloyl-ACP methyl ester carboxylesterase
VRVLLVPGGGSSVDGYFGGIAESLRTDFDLVAVDPPRLDVASGRRWLKLPAHAAWLTRAVRAGGGEPVVVVGHSLGGLVALRFALDNADLTAGLLLLDPSPPIFASVVPAPVLRQVGRARRAARLRARASLPRAVPLHVRMRWIIVGGLGVAADVAAGRGAGVRTVVVSAAAHPEGSVFRRTHRWLAATMPEAVLEVWPETTHELHREQPAKVVETARRLARLA